MTLGSQRWHRASPWGDSYKEMGAAGSIHRYAQIAIVLARGGARGWLPGSGEANRPLDGVTR
jgi:hypothetical protein